MITIFWIVLATWFWSMPTYELQSILDKKSGIYVSRQDISFESGINLIAAHNYKSIGRKITKMKVWDQFAFDNKKCTAIDKVIVNYRTQTAEVLNGADLYLQTCIKWKADLAYLIKAQCK